jgi:energy-converting hydrogenase Eha subunit E
MNVAIDAYKLLRPYRLNIYAVEDILLWNNKKGAIFFFSCLNLIFWLIASLNFPVYSIISIGVFLVFIGKEKLVTIACFVTSSLRYRDSYAEADDIITLEHLCAFIGVFTHVWKDFIRFVKLSFLDFNLSNVALLTFIVFSTFIASYYLGDKLCIWVIVHFILFIAMILYYRIGFKIMHFPWKVEREFYHAIMTYKESH